MLRRYLRLLGVYARLDWELLTRDSLTGLLYMLSDWISSLSSISGIALLAVRFGGVGGLTTDEVLWLLGFYALADGATYLFMGNNNVINISRRIGRGQADAMLLQPVPLWMQIFSEGFIPFSGGSIFLVGLFLVIFSGIRLHITVTPLWLLMLFLYVLARIAVAVAVGLISGSAAFYHPVVCEELSPAALDVLNTVGKYPMASLPYWAQAVFCTVLPAGLMAWLPGMALLHKLNAPVLYAWPVAAGAMLLALAGLIFRKGLTYYGKHGCPRYKDLGYR